MRRLTCCGIVAAMVLCGCNTAQQNREAAQARWELARSKISFQLAKSAYDTGNLAECKKQIARAIATDHAFAPAYLLGAKVAMRENRYEEVQDYITMAMRVDPNSGEAWYAQALLDERTGVLDEAIEAASKAVECDPNDPEYLILLAELQVRQNELDRAVATLSAVEARFALHEGVQSVLADLYGMAGNNQAAVVCLERLVRLDPEDIGLQERLALALVRDGRGAEALPMLENVLRSDKAKGEAISLRSAMADCYVQTGDQAKAEQAYAALCQEDPNNAEWRYRLAECYAMRHDDAAALEQAQTALRLSPDHANAHALAGYLCFSAGKLEQAEEHLRQAMERTDQAALVAALLSKTFQAQGRADEAEEVWNQFGGRAEVTRQKGAADEVASSSPQSWVLLSGETAGQSVKQ